MSLTKSTDKGSTPVTCLTFRQITWPLKASGAIHSSPHPPFHCTLSNNANSLVSGGTDSLGSRGLSPDSDCSLFPCLPLMGVVFELLVMAVTLFVILLKKYNFTFLLNKYYDLFYKTLQRIGYCVCITIYNSIKKKKAATRNCRQVTIFA